MTKLTKEHLLRYFYEENLDPYKIFHQNREAKKNLAKKIADGLLEYVPDDMEVLRILDVGCGGGELTQALLEDLVMARPKLKIELTAADPAKKILEIAKLNLKDITSKYENVDIEYKQVGVYPQPVTPLRDACGGKQFDFILASFIMFWMENLNNAVDQFLECLHPDGFIGVILISREMPADGENFNSYSGFRTRVFEIAHNSTGYSPEFAEDFEAVLNNRKSEEFDWEMVDVEIDLGFKYKQEITPTMEFLIRYPKDKLTKNQTKDILKYANTLESEKLKGQYKVMWVKRKPELYPLSFTQIDVAYIYPFLFDFQSIPVPENCSVMQAWVDPTNVRDKKGYQDLVILHDKYKLEWGLPKSRRGFLPILPYHSLAKRYGYHEWSEEEFTIGGKTLEERGHKLKRTMIIRECGNGSLTYEFKIEQGVTRKAKIENVLLPIIRLIPRVERKKNGLVNDEEQYKLKVGKDKWQELFKHARNELKGIENTFIEYIQKKPIGDHHWEDRDVLYLFDKEDRNDERISKDVIHTTHADNEEWPRSTIQPYSFIVFHLTKKEYRKVYKYLQILSGYQGNKDFPEEVKCLGMLLLLTMYRYWCWDLWDSFDLENIDISKIGAWVNLSANSRIACFVNHASVVVFVETGEENKHSFCEKYFLPTILNCVETAVTRTHFAHILDALLDDFLEDVHVTNDPEILQKFQKHLYIIQMQIAIFLEETSQYIQTDHVGANMSRALHEALHEKELEQRILQKLNLTERVLVEKRLHLAEWGIINDELQ